METTQTQALSTEFANLSVIMQENSGLHDRAIAAITSKLEAIQSLDLTKLDIIAGDQIDAELNELQGRGAEAVEVNMQRRAPITKRFDEVRSVFTGYENAIKAKVEAVKAWRVTWNKEKYNRDLKQKQELQATLDKQNAEIAFGSHCADSINNHYMAYLGNTIDRFNQAYNNKAAVDFGQYELDMKAYVPVMDSFAYPLTKHPLLSDEEMSAIKAKTEADVMPILAKDFVHKLSTERDRLVSLIPSRIAELQRAAENPAEAQAAAERLQRESVDRMAELSKEKADRSEAIVATAENDKLTTMLDAVAAIPMVGLSKGTKVKQKYNATTHKAFIGIIQWWVKNQMALMTVEELNKKFSFMMTAANKALNDATKAELIEAEGLFVIEDFTTRATATK